MTISVRTRAYNGHLIACVIDQQGALVLTLHDTSADSCVLLPGHVYRFEWHVWTVEHSTFTIEATVLPVSPGFPGFNFHRQYEQQSQDYGGFTFTA